MCHRRAFSATNQIVLACAIGLLSAGCSLIPAYQRPAMPVPARYPQTEERTASPGETARAAQDVGWRAYFPDLDLQDLIAAALAQNRDLRLAALRVQEARALYGAQAAARWPALNFEATMTRPHAAADAYANQLGVAVPAYELDFFGRLKSLSEAALHDYLGTEQARRAAQISLVAEVAKAYVQERTAVARVALARRSLASRSATVALIGRRERAGLSSPLDLRQAESLIGPAEADLIEQQLAQARASHALALLTGYARSAPSGNMAVLDDRWGAVQAGIPSDLLASRPDILAAEERLKAAYAHIGAARAAFFPSIKLTAQGGVASNDFGKLFNLSSGAWQLVPQLSLPIFDAGRNQANLDLSRARKELAVAEYEKTIQVAFREVADVLAGQTLLERDLAVRAETRDSETARLALTTRRYLAGTIGYLDMLDAERALFTAEKNLAESRRARLENAINFYRVLGGGYEATSVDKAPVPLPSSGT